ncbi:MAG: M6 family metalloprotease domain-containing protein [Coriobacteriia bacterium]|nr:M6 family metalloprotease domain-containing protein [Coriobacteriia bacterium]
MKFKLAVMVAAALVALAVTPVVAFANSPGPLLSKAAAEDPALAARLTELESNAQALGVDSVADKQLRVLPDKTGVPRLMVTPQATTTGPLRTLAILVDFSDHPYQVASTFFDDMLFADLFGPASLRGYYREVSYGTPSTRGLIDIVTVDGNEPSSLEWTRLPQSLAYYAGTEYGRGTYPNNSQKMVEDAIGLVNSRVDFSQYDNDGDGYVDNVMVIHAGEGAEYNGPIANHIWSHAWATRTPILCDGVYVWQYSTEPEYWATPGDMRPGVYAHELGHTLGLPDLYDRDGTSSGIGEWSLMASGSWNGPLRLGDSPARMDAWSSARLGWLQPQTATGAAVSRSLPAVGTSRAASAWKMYPNGATSGSEYWLFENRQQTGTDSGIPGSGILVWHVDEAMIGYNDQNDNEAHKLVDLEEAAGTQSMDSKTDRGTAADPYPGTTNNRAFRASSVPNSNRSSGAASLVVMDSVSDNSASMTARIGMLANTMSLNAGAVFTNSPSVTVASSVSGASTMRINTGLGFGSWVNYASSYGIVLPAGDGLKTVTVEYRDAASATIASLSDSIILDTTGPPVLDLASPSHVSEATWYSNNTATINWSSSDAGSGVSGYSYVLDTNASTTPDTVQDSTWSSFTYSSLGDGTRYFHVRVCDNAGNWGPVSHRMIRVDTTPPVTTTSIEPQKYEFTANVSLFATDASSLVASTTYTLDGGPELAFTGAFDVTDMGIHTLSYRSRDNAGNDETAKQVVFSIVEDDSVSILSVDGPDRFATAVASSKLGFASADTVLIATGRNWPDALGASSLAGALGSPILLVEKSLVPSAVTTEIQRLGATKAIIIGGTGAVDYSVAGFLSDAGLSVRRIAGTDRYDTARKVAAETITAVGPAYDGTLFVATGQNFADALAASPAAAANGWPTLLVPSDSGVPAATLDFAALHGRRAVILGGTSAVSFGAWSDLWGVFGTSGVTRIGGTDRFDTAVKVADWSVAHAGLSYASPAIATGRSPYDALAGGVVQGTGGSVLLLTESATLPAQTASALARNVAMISQVRFLGGLAAVDQTVRDGVSALLTP